MGRAKARRRRARPTRTADTGAPFDARLEQSGRGLSAEIGAATIDEMLDLMAKQIMQVIAWTQAEGFLDAYTQCQPERPRVVSHSRDQAGRARRPTPSRLRQPA